MQFIIATLLLIGAVSVVSSISLAPLNEKNENTIDEEYIVIFKEAAREIDVQKHLKFVDLLMTKEPNDTYRVNFVYDMGPTFRGYAALMTEQMLLTVRSMQEVEYVERNEFGEFLEVSAQPNRKLCRNQALTNSNWALSRISHLNIQSSPLQYRYNYYEEGVGVNIYVVDSGIDTTNPDFGGRASWGIRVGGGLHVDNVGHGTKVAGCAMSNTYGSARRGNAVAVAIDKNGKPYASYAIAGFQWVQKHHKRNKSVANASFQFSSTTVNRAANALIDSGVILVVAAGNSPPVNACNHNPASVPRAITVAASDRNDNFASFSCYGNCVNVIAPGVSIQTTGKNNQNPTTTSGTSYSAPYTAGILAAMMESSSPSDARRKLFQRAAVKKIKGNLRGTPNRLLNSRC